MFIDGRYEASIPVQETLHALALRRAIVVAHASVSAMTRSCSSIMVSEQVRLLRELTELEISLKQIEASVLLKMGTEMKQKEKVLIVYDVLNSDGDAGISVSELAEGLRKLNEKQNFQEVIPVAEKAIAYFSEDGVLSPDQVESFLENLSLSLRTSFHSLCQLCIAKIGFGTTGRAILEEMVAHIDHDDVGSEEFDNQISFSRMVLLFQMIDGKLEGRVRFKDVVKHIFRFSEKFDFDERDVLLLMDETDRTMDFNELMAFLLEICTSLPCSVHELANAMTISACRQDVTDHDIKDLFVDEDKRFMALEFAEDSGFEDVLAFGKLHRLHQLMDSDGSGTIDQSELALGLRKFTSCQSGMEESLAEAMAAIRAVDEDGDGELDSKEFAKLIARFANTAEVKLQNLIDFMVVQSSMKCNDQREKAFIENYKRLKSMKRDEVMEDESVAQQRQSRRGSSIFSSWTSIGSGVFTSRSYMVTTSSSS